MSVQQTPSFTIVQSNTWTQFTFQDWSWNETSNKDVQGSLNSNEYIQVWVNETYRMWQGV